MLLRNHLQTVHHRCTLQQAYTRTRCFLFMVIQYTTECAVDQPSTFSDKDTDSIAR